MQTSLEELAQVVRSRIETNTDISPKSFGCGARGDQLMVKLLLHHIKREVELPDVVTQQVTKNKVVNLFSQDHKALANTVVAMLK